MLEPCTSSELHCGCTARPVSMEVPWGEPDACATDPNRSVPPGEVPWGEPDACATDSNRSVPPSRGIAAASFGRGGGGAVGRGGD